MSGFSHPLESAPQIVYGHDPAYPGNSIPVSGVENNNFMPVSFVEQQQMAFAIASPPSKSRAGIVGAGPRKDATTDEQPFSMI
jgi:hypothetical protein